MKQEKEFLKLTIPNDLSYFTIAQNHVREAAKHWGFSGQPLDAIDIAIEESVTNVMKHTYDAEENDTFDIICKRIPGGIKIIIKEMGIPFDPSRVKSYELSQNIEEADTAGLGMHLIKTVMDDYEFHNLGVDGKETHLTKYLPGQTVQSEIQDKQEVNEPTSITEKIEYTVRGLEEQEAVEVSRCAYKSHGYSFFDDHIYFPDKLIELNKTLQMISAVAVTKDNVFMGHGALLYQDPDDSIAELTFIFVNVEYRGQGALNRLVEYIFDVPKKRALAGIYAYAVANHIFSQKSMLKNQINDCGILLATSPASWKFKGISDDRSQRVSVILEYKYMGEPKVKTLFVPQHHLEMVDKLYKNIGGKPIYATPESTQLEFKQAKTEIDSGDNQLEGCAEIFIFNYGPDVVKELKRTVRGFCLKGISAINLFVNLEDPLTHKLTEEFEKLGCFFAGILPCSRIGDALILQYLNNVDLNYSKINAYSDIAKEMLAYIQQHDPNIF